MAAVEFSPNGYKFETLPLTKMRENTKEQWSLTLNCLQHNQVRNIWLNMELPLHTQTATVLQEAAKEFWTRAVSSLYVWQALKQQTQPRKLYKKPWFMSVRAADCIFIFLACPPASDQSRSNPSVFLISEETILKF